MWVSRCSIRPHSNSNVFAVACSTCSYCTCLFRNGVLSKTGATSSFKMYVYFLKNSTFLYLLGDNMALVRCKPCVTCGWCAWFNLLTCILNANGPKPLLPRSCATNSWIAVRMNAKAVQKQEEECMRDVITNTQEFPLQGCLCKATHDHYFLSKQSCA